jgi:ABC-2 type transport system permease protein
MKLLIEYMGFELKRFFSNKRLALIFFIGPMIASAVFALITYQSPSSINIGLNVKNNNKLAQQLVSGISQNKTFVISSLPSEAEGLQQFRTGKIKAFVVIDVNDNQQGAITLVGDPRYPEIQGIVREQVSFGIKDILVQNAISFNTKNISQNLITNNIDPTSVLSSLQIKTEPVSFTSGNYTPKPTKYIDLVASGMIALVIALIFLLKAATSLSQDRESGVLERLFSTPASRRKLMLGKIIANVIIGLISVIVIVLMLRFGFGAAMGNGAIVLLVSFLTAIVSVTMGILISAIVKDLAATIQFTFYTFFMMVLTSEFFFARENIYRYFQWVSYINPLTYAISALRKINLFNWGLHDIWRELIALSVFTVVYTVIAIILIDRESK